MAEFGGDEVGPEDAGVVGLGEHGAALAEGGEGLAVVGGVAGVPDAVAGELGEEEVPEDVANVGAGIEHGFPGLPPAEDGVVDFEGDAGGLDEFEELAGDVVLDELPGEAAKAGVVRDLGEAGGGDVRDKGGLGGDVIEKLRRAVVVRHLGSVAGDGIDGVHDEPGLFLLRDGEGALAFVTLVEAAFDLLEASAHLGIEL